MSLGRILGQKRLENGAIRKDLEVMTEMLINEGLSLTREINNVLGGVRFWEAQGRWETFSPVL